MKKQLLSLSVFLLLVQFAQAQFTLDGEFRPRAELRNGFSSLIPEDTDAGFAINTRVRLNAGYKTDAYKFYLSLQDIMVWGENGSISPDDQNNSFAVFQAWAELNLGSGFSTKIGRQVLSYDDQRILGGLNWAQQGRNHDAALFRYSLPESKLKIDIALAFNQDFDADDSNFFLYQDEGTAYTGASYKTMQMLHLNKKWDKFGLSLLALNVGAQAYETDGVTPDGTTDQQIFGTHLKYNEGAFGAAANFYYHTIEDVDGGGYEASLDLTYKASDKITFGLGGEIISGADGDNQQAFQPLFGTNHKFNGFMDYFYVQNHGGTGLGLIDLHAMAKIKTGEKSGLLVKVLNFQTEQDFNDDNQLGTEVDLVFTQKFDGYALKLGYSQMFGSESLEVLNGTPDPKGTQNWAWAMLIIKPKFFGGAKKKAPMKK